MIRESSNRVSAGLGVALGLLLFTAPSAGQPALQGIRVTDPAELAAMGFRPGAIVYRAPGVESEADSPDEFGTVASGYSAYNGDQFHGRESTYAYACSICFGDAYYIGGDPVASVQVHMPSGSSFKGVRWWGYDNNAADLQFYVIRTCLPVSGGGLPGSLVLATATSSGTPGDDSAFINIPGVETVDNQACTYWIRTVWNASSTQLQLYKVRAQWERQVSPAPAVATFGDVPTDHPYFQFVEALSASYITAGCDAAPPLYCPDAPLTRGQMAVFLSKALGLHWP